MWVKSVFQMIGLALEGTVTKWLIQFDSYLICSHKHWKQLQNAFKNHDCYFHIKTQFEQLWF